MRQVYIRTLNRKEIKGLYIGLKSYSAFTHRRCQILISSAEGKSVKEISRSLYCSDQCVRDAIRSFNRNGIKCIHEKENSRNNSSKTFDENAIRSLQKIISRHPSYYGIKTESWTLELLANVCYEEKIINKKVSSRTMGFVIKRVGIDWKYIKKTGIKKR